MSIVFLIALAGAAGVTRAEGAPLPDAAPVRARFERVEARRMVPLLQQVIRFPTVAGNDRAWNDQKAWLERVARDLGFGFRDDGKVAEIDLPGPAGAPVLGLVIHGDVQPVGDPARWRFPPFSGVVKNGYVEGRGAADDKGPLVQALLVMKALAASGLPRTHTVRLLVGSDEESTNTDFTEYLRRNRAPDYSLVLDSLFPVVVGEKAWNALWLTTSLDERQPGPFEIVNLEAGISPGIVPDVARLTLRWKQGTPAWPALIGRLRAKRLPDGTKLATVVRGDTLIVTVTGRAAHGGVNIRGGRNALVALAGLVQGALPAGGADDLLAFARLAGQDLEGTGLGLVRDDSLWGRATVNVAQVGRTGDVVEADAARSDTHTMVINVRTNPGETGSALQARLEAVVAEFNRKNGASLLAGGYFKGKPLSFDPKGKLVVRLLEAFARATGTRKPPVVSPGGTYAKRIPNAIPFGMWFPDKPYPGHDVNERVPIRDLHRGAHVLIEALVDIACAPPLKTPFAP